MTRLGAEAWLAAAAIWVSVMLPSAAFGGFDGAAGHAGAARQYAVVAMPATGMVRPL